MKKIIFIIYVLFWASALQSQNITVSIPTVESQDTLVQVQVPFYVSGLDGTTGGMPVIAMEFYVYYDSSQVNYINAINFYSGTPATQWIYGSNGIKFGSNWVHPQLLPINIPDNTKLFDLVFYYKKATNTILDISETECVLVDANFQQIPDSSIVFVDGAIHYTGFTQPPPGLVEIIPESFISFPDTVFNVPVFISGFGLANSSLTNLNLYLDFNNSLINFENASNFSNLLPAGEWTISYETAQNKLVCSWTDPLMENMQIPNGTKLFDLDFKGQAAGQTPITFDSIACSYSHNHNGIPKPLTANYQNSTVEIFDIPNPPPGQVEFNPDLYVVYADSMISVPVYISGFNSENSSISNLEIVVDFDSEKLDYQMVSAFNELLPSNEWTITYDQVLNHLDCVWNQPSIQNLNIPDNSKLFEISLKALVPGNTTLSFDETSCQYLHQFMGYVIPFNANYNNAQIQIYDWTVPLPGLVEIVPDSFVVNPDTLVYVPIRISGFNQENSSLSDMQLVLDFNQNILNYQTATGFSNILPEEQWNITYNEAESRMVCTWEEPLLNNVLINNNTVLFELVFKAAALGSSLLQFDSVSCLFHHQLVGNTVSLTANFGNSIVEVIEIPLPPPGLIAIVPDTFNTNPDLLINVPIVLSGFGAENSSLSNLELVMEFDNQMVEYQTTSNFAGIMPGNEWNITYDQEQSRMVCAWDNSNSQNIAIPDNTTIFEFVFKTTAIGTSAMHFDSVSSVIIHKINGTNQEITANFSDATVIVEEIPLPPPGLVAIEPDYFISYPDSSFHVPVFISGFGSAEASLSGLELAIGFNNQVIDFEQATAFGSLLPQDQWSITYQPDDSRLLCVWENPTGNNLPIPDGTPLFELVFKGQQLGISPLEFDSLSSVFNHKQNGGTIQLTAIFSNAMVQIIVLTPPITCYAKIIPDTISGISGNIINVPVVLFGLNGDTNSIMAAEFYIDFDKYAVSYQGITNFNPLMPLTQWIYNVVQPDSNRFACNWVEPTLQNLSIPDSTTIFELQFLCIANETPLTFDATANVFVHIDQEFNLIEVPVGYSDGYVIVLPDAVESVSAEKINVSVVNRKLIIKNISGIARVFNLAGQLVKSKNLTPEDNEMDIQQQGIYVISVIDNDKRLFSGKIYIK